LKTEQEIRDEIEATARTLSNYEEAYVEGRVRFDVLSDKTTDYHATISALKWVLGENDRYD
jgi:hypothetical protein